MNYAGIDVSTLAIDVVLLDAETAAARHQSFPLNNGPGDYLARARRVPELLPVRTAWKDTGVCAIGVEKPMSSDFKAAVPLSVVLGAVLAVLPRDHQVPLFLFEPHLWKKWSLGGGFPGKGNAKKDEVRSWAVETWSDRPAGADQNAFDAYAIAWACRALHEQHLSERRSA